MRFRCSYCGSYVDDTPVKLGDEHYHLKCAVENAKKLKIKYFSSIVNRKNVVGMGIKLDESGELKLAVNVEKKEDSEYLRGYDEVPRMLGDVKTDVVVVGKMLAPRPVTSKASSSLRRRERMRPAPGGVSVSHYGLNPDIISAGTFGFLLIADGGGYMVSNNHVFAEENMAGAGDPIYQPGTLDGGRKKDSMAYLEDFVPIKFGDSEMNAVDLAIARPKKPNMVSTEILGMGTPMGFTELHLGDRVTKSGRTTGITRGQVAQIHVTSKVGYEHGTAVFDDQILIDKPGFSEGGDSGSAILNEKGMRIGALLFAGSEYDTLATPINTVLKIIRERIS